MEKPCPLCAGHRDGFDCGEAALNTYLRKHALQSQRSHGTVTYVALADNRVVGYYTLLYNGSIDCDTAPERVSQGLGNLIRRYRSLSSPGWRSIAPCRERDWVKDF